jgi:hypothetical protein
VTSLERYVRRVADLMDLGEWRITTKVKALGNTEAHIEQKNWWDGKARLTIDRKCWEAASRKRRRRIVVHELVHLHLMPYSYIVQRFTDGDVVAEEMMVERMTNVIAPHMPLPPKVKA